MRPSGPPQAAVERFLRRWAPIHRSWLLTCPGQIKAFTISRKLRAEGGHVGYQEEYWTWKWDLVHSSCYHLLSWPWESPFLVFWMLLFFSLRDVNGSRICTLYSSWSCHFPSPKPSDNFLLQVPNTVTGPGPQQNMVPTYHASLTTLPSPHLNPAKLLPPRGPPHGWSAIQTFRTLTPTPPPHCANPCSSLQLLSVPFLQGALLWPPAQAVLQI